MDPRRFASRMTNWDKKIRRTYPTDFYIAVRTLIPFIPESQPQLRQNSRAMYPHTPNIPNTLIFPFFLFVPVGYHRHIYKCIREIKGALKIFSKATSKQESSKSEYFFKGDFHLKVAMRTMEQSSKCCPPARWRGIIKKIPRKAGNLKVLHDVHKEQ